MCMNASSFGNESVAVARTDMTLACSFILHTLLSVVRCVCVSVCACLINLALFFMGRQCS